MIRIDWGDGTAQVLKGEAVKTELTHTYADALTRTVVISFETDEAEKDLQARIDKFNFERGFGKIDAAWAANLAAMFAPYINEPIDPSKWCYPHGETDIDAMLRGESKDET